MAICIWRAQVFGPTVPTTVAKSAKATVRTASAIRSPTRVPRSKAGQNRQLSVIILLRSRWVSNVGPNYFRAASCLAFCVSDTLAQAMVGTKQA